MKTPFTIVLLACCAMSLSIVARSQDTAASHVTVTTDTSENKHDGIFLKVERESYFPGGSGAWLQYLQQHLVYPRKAVRRQIEGTVVLQFIVNKDGSISDLQAITGDPLLREAALKAMADCPRWVPAEQHGRIVRSYKKQPVVFKLQP